MERSDSSSLPPTSTKHPSVASGVKKSTKFSKILEPLRQMRDDPAHAIFNGVCDMMKAIAGLKSFKMTPRDWAFETSLGRRFAPNNRDKKLKAPWQANKTDIDEVNKIIPLIGLWTCAEPIRSPFRKEKMKIAESFMYCGPLGHYLIENLGSVDLKYRALYHLQLRVYTKLLYNGFDSVDFKDTIQNNHSEVLVFLTKSEIAFPIKWNKITRHQIKHAWSYRGFIPELGSTLEWCMLGAERWGI